MLYAVSIASAVPNREQDKNHREPTEVYTLTVQKPTTSYYDKPADLTTTPAYRYGQLSRAACEAELRARHIPFRRASAVGVLAPVRLTGPLRGVLFRGEGTEKERAKSLHEIIDCRLVLALDDCAELLQSRGIVEVRHYSIYRLPEKSWPKAKPAARHMGGVAIDAGLFIKKDGRALDVNKHFHGAIGAKTCGAGAAPKPATADALELRAMLCDIVALRLFNVVLTPNYNPPHKNHFHLEVAADKKWFLVH